MTSADRNFLYGNDFHAVSTSNHMFTREIWDKFTEFTFLKFSPNFTNKHVIPGLSHMTSSQKAHKGKNYTKKQSININKFDKHNSITPKMQQLLRLFVIIIIIIISN